MVTRATNRLTDRFFENIPAGKVEWIGVRPERKQPMHILTIATAVEGKGLQGDRRMQGNPQSARQVTLIQAEHLPVIATLLKKEAIDPAILRRNIVVSGINLSTLRHRQFKIGSAIFEGASSCPPCSRMEQALGAGGFAAMLGHGGLCAKVVSGGDVSIGCSVAIHLPQRTLAL